MAGPEHHGINARAAEGFANSANYDKHRPSYTPTVVEQALSQCRVSGRKHAKILDLAAGGGKFTELLARRAEGFEIVAVEPHDGMREVLEGKKLAGVSVKAGRADGIPLEDESVDAVVVAQVGISIFSLIHCLHNVLWYHAPTQTRVPNAHVSRPSTGSPPPPPSKKSTASSAPTASSPSSGTSKTTTRPAPTPPALLGKPRCGN